MNLGRQLHTLDVEPIEDAEPAPNVEQDAPTPEPTPEPAVQ